MEYAFGSAFALGPLSFSVGTGVTSLVGANGAGKSTLMGLLCGMLRPRA
ncbi:MAG: ATP-binding cassette domain-containing protein, partial [Cellulomonadaceae bacterium]|nr:ATP-binding cassette domain-containing protein [Cellulomonadaceae bacterium]